MKGVVKKTIDSSLKIHLRSDTLTGLQIFFLPGKHSYSPIFVPDNT